VQYIPLVRRLAHQLRARLPANIELDDLIQAGLMGLLDALRRYQQTPDARFESYATTRIRGAMLDELRAQDWLPRSVRSKARSIEEAIHTLSHRLMRPATEIEIAAELGLSVPAYQKLLEETHGMQVVHQEDLGRNRDDGSRAAQPPPSPDIVAEPESGPYQRLVSKGLRRDLIQAIQELPEREQLVLSLQFEQDLSQKEIAAVLGVTEGRVSQLRSQAVLRIRAGLDQAGWRERPAEIETPALS